MWVDDGRVYLIGVDNGEQAQTDVDIFDITDPTAPVAVREYDFDDEFPAILDGEENGLGNNVLLHDMVVKEIDGIQTLLASYWDGGYVLVNVEEPDGATYIGDTRFDDTDPLTGATPPEGNAHQAEFSHDNNFILAADEDFDTRRIAGTVDPDGDSFQFNGAGQTDGGPLLSSTRTMTGDTRYVGSGCIPANDPAGDRDGQDRDRPRVQLRLPAQDRERRREGLHRTGHVRRPATRSSSGLLVRHPDQPRRLCTTTPGDVVTLWVTREAGFRMMGRARASRAAATNPTPTPAAPDRGRSGRHRLGLRRLGLRAPVPQRHGQAGRGGLAVRDPGGRSTSATPPTSVTCRSTSSRPTPDVNLAYASYYSGGLRVLSFGDDGLKEVGRYIDPAREQLLGGRAVHQRLRPADRHLGPRLRPVHPALHGRGSGAAVRDAARRPRRRRLAGAARSART